MLGTMFVATLLMGAAQEGPDSSKVPELIATIDALQHPVEDFECEYEGTLRFSGPVRDDILQARKLGEDGLAETVSGKFLWKRGGDVHVDGFRQSSPEGSIMRESAVLRPAEGRAEHHLRPDNASLGTAEIKKNADEIGYWMIMSPGQFQLIQKIKEAADDPFYRTAVHDGQIDDRPVKVVDVRVTKRDRLLNRYYIDMARSGQVIRRESFAPTGEVDGRDEIKLEAFKIGDAEVWMPVYCESRGYAKLKDRLPVPTKDPTSFQKVYVVGGTMRFNRHPGREAFMMNYKLGTPISDSIRQMESGFGQMKIAPKPSKAEVSRLLEEQLKKAEEQKSELVALPPSAGVAWSFWALGAFGALAVVSLIVYGSKNLRRY